VKEGKESGKTPTRSFIFAQINRRREICSTSEEDGSSDEKG